MLHSNEFPDETTFTSTYNSCALIVWSERKVQITAGVLSWNVVAPTWVLQRNLNLNQIMID